MQPSKKPKAAKGAIPDKSFLKCLKNIQAFNAAKERPVNGKTKTFSLMCTGNIKLHATYPQIAKNPEANDNIKNTTTAVT